MSVNGDVADDGGEEATSGEIEERIEDFKQDKARQKSSFTRIKNKLLRMLDEQDYPSRREIKEMCHNSAMLRNVLWKLCIVFQWNTRSLSLRTEKKGKKSSKRSTN